MPATRAVSGARSRSVRRAGTARGALRRADGARFAATSPPIHDVRPRERTSPAAPSSLSRPIRRRWRNTDPRA
jgi:hypothetical protein